MRYLQEHILVEFAERCIPFELQVQDDGNALTIGEWAQSKDFAGRSKTEKNRAYVRNVRRDPARWLLFKIKRAEMARAAYARKRAAEAA